MNRLAATLRRLRSSSHSVAESTELHAPLQTAEELKRLLERVRTLRLREVQHTRANLLSVGEFASTALGRGLDLEEVRAYTPGDNIRDMDWRTTARRGKPYIKVYRESRQTSVCLLVDRGASMRFATRGYLKVTQAVRIAAAYAYAHADHEACIGGVLYDDHVTALSCRPGMRGAIEWAHHAVEPCPPLAASAACVALSSLYTAVTRVAPRGSQILWLSDFTQFSENALPWLAQLSQRFSVTALRVVDSAERALPDVGMAPFTDAGGIRWLNTAARSVRTAFVEVAENERVRIAGLFASVGIALEECETVDDAVAVAARLLTKPASGSWRV